MLGLLHAFPYTRKLALVGSCMDVNGGGDVFRVNNSGENMDYAISTSKVRETVWRCEVLALHFYALPDEDVVTLSRWLSRASELEGLYVKVTNDTDILAAQKLVSNCTSTLRKLNVHIYEDGIWMVPIDLKACQCLQSLNICCTDYYGHMLVDILESIGPVTGADPLQIWLRMARCIAAMGMGNITVKVSVIHNSDIDWTKTRFNDEADYGDWIRLNCFKAVVEAMEGRFVLKSN
ncbi:hypothetical protein EV421DRAFT_1735280 [Armillaria borealis]|uniref:Uncharacterized protein n=1 Tax=Armillaria borealis TaxID=47425 RepID=A0AA39JMM6_9AGAR|nr:hypothetical protein EV421DRAFT_1735280 [Armillaria borealis]